MPDVNRRVDWAPDDETLEYAARLIEETDLTDHRGLMSETDEGQRAYQLQYAARKETRQSAARLLRAMMKRPELDAKVVLARIAEEIAGDHYHDASLAAAWPLAWKGWLDIEARVKCNDSSLPPRTHFHIKLTERGRHVLAETLPASPNPLT